MSNIKVKLLEYTPNPEKIVAMAGKLCYSSTDIDELEENLTEENINKFVTMLISMGHESPVEHVSFTFAIEGVSRITEQQLTRHRIASYSIQSGRYVQRDNPDCVMPPRIEEIPEARQEFIKAMEESQMHYNKLTMILLNDYAKEELDGEIPIPEDTKMEYPYAVTLESVDTKTYNALLKRAIEDARYAYPQALATKIIVTMNLRQLLHFFNKRCCNRSQWEIRTLAYIMLEKCKKVAPLLFAKAGAECIKTGKCPEGKMSCGLFPTK